AGSTVTGAWIVVQTPRIVQSCAVTRCTPTVSGAESEDVLWGVESPSAPQACTFPCCPPMWNKRDRSSPSTHTRKLRASAESGDATPPNWNTATGRSIGTGTFGLGETSTMVGAG